MASETIKRVRLGEVLSVKARIGWQGLTQKEHMPDGEYHLVTGVDFKNGFVDFNKCVYVSRERYEQDPNIQLREGDILLTKDGTIGKVAVVGEMKMPATLNSGVFVLRDLGNHFETRYLYHYFLAPDFRALVERQLTGCTIPHLNQKILVALQIPKPTLPAQRKIAAALDKISEMKRNAEARLQKLDLLVRSRFNEMFGDEKNQLRIGDLFETQSGGTPKSSERSYYDGGDIPWLTSGEVNLGVITSTQKFITKAGLDNSSAKWTPENSVLVAMYGATAGKVGLLKIKATTNQAVCAILPRADVVPEYLYQAVSQQENWMIQQAAGGAQPNISQSVVRRMAIPFPTLSRQRSFAAFVEKVEALKATVQASLARVDLLYRAKLQEYFG